LNEVKSHAGVLFADYLGSANREMGRTGQSHFGPRAEVVRRLHRLSAEFTTPRRSNFGSRTRRRTSRS